jgi:hypothetical protein
MKYEDDQFEGLLNDSLIELREAEPRTGFEGRVLAGVRGAEREPKVGWWKWTAVAAMVMLIVLGIAVRRASKTDVVKIQPAKTAPETPKSLPPQKDAGKRDIIHPGSEAAKRSVAVRNTNAGPRPQQKTESIAASTPIPAPAPLSPQEKALILLARNNPEVLLRMQKEPALETRKLAPIEIEPIEIKESGEKEQ